MTEVVFIEEQPAKGKEHQVKPGSTIGREGCDFVLPDPEVSRRHAAIRQLDDSLAVEDLDSTNGTFVNGERITGIRRIEQGDGVRFGNTVWRVGAPSNVTRLAQSPGTLAVEVSPAAPAQPTASPDHGDVPPPDFAAAPVQPVTPTPAQLVEFSPPPGRALRRSAARRVEATAIAYAVVLATAVAVALYFVTR